MSTARGNADGFVLVATLWVLAALAVLAAYIDGVVADRSSASAPWRLSQLPAGGARPPQHRGDARLPARHRAHEPPCESSSRRSSASSNDPARKGSSLPDARRRRDSRDAVRGLRRPRRGTSFSVQDEGGLVSVNRAGDSPSSPPCSSTPESSPIPTSERIVARVEDYIDSDHTLILNGAEHHDYRAKEGERPPLNWIMASPHELRERARSRAR